MPSRLTPIEQPAALALVTGDSRRAFALAGKLMVQPRMSHQARGLWGYTGETPDGLDLTVQSTGSGGPGAVAVLGDLAALGVIRAIRLGSCLVPAGTKLGSVLLVEKAIVMDGASRGLSETAPETGPDPSLFETLSGIGRPETVSSHDLVARFDPSGPLPAEGAGARDLQTAATFAAGRRFGFETAAVLIAAADSAGNFLEEAELNEHFVETALNVTERLQPHQPNPQVEG